MCENCPERGTLCPNCGADPCYHLCVNSPHYYSPEQELFDAMMDDGSDDRRERYANETIGLEDEDTGFSEADHNPWVIRSDFLDGGRITPVNDDDIPF